MSWLTKWFSGNTDVSVDSDTLALRTHDAEALAVLTGLITTQASTGPVIAATTTLALAANANRVYASFVNDSNEDMYLAFGAAAVLHTGVLVKASGGSYEITHANLFKGQVNAICASGTKVLCVSEGV
jgi:hypothetical protein